MVLIFWIDVDRVLILSIKGRKFTMEELRKRMSKRTEHFMRIKQDSFYEELGMEELVSEYQRISEPLDEALSINNLKLILKTFHRQRFLSCWHDTSTVSNSSHLLITFAILYDPALYYTDEEYFELTGKSICGE